MEQLRIRLFWKFIEPRYWWLRHILFLLNEFSNYIFSCLNIIYLETGGKDMWTAYIIPNFILIYIDLLLLAPLLVKKKFVPFIIASLAVFCTYSIASFWFNPTTVAEGDVTPVWVEFIQGIGDAVDLSAKVIFLRWIIQYIYEYRQEQELKTERLGTELAYLKNQINPHFLFNTLNNIAVLADLYPDRVTPTIVELSNVLRYQLYESEKNSVLLFNEVENLRQNLNLEAMRLNEVEANINVEGDITGVQVAPLLFLPFLENALKHSANPSGVAVISLYFTMENEKTLLFTSKNSKPPVKSKQIAGGLGLKNTQRRLELLYPNKHELTVEETKDWYNVTLRLKV